MPKVIFDSPSRQARPRKTGPSASSKHAQSRADTPTYTKGQQTRERILGEAAQQFAHKGFSATAVADIMGACGLTKGGFYAHFSSKEALYIETVRALLDRERAKYRPAPASASPEQRLKAFFEWMRESLAGDRPLGRQFLWMVLEPDSSVTRHVIDEVFHSTYAELHSLLALTGRESHPDVVASSLLAIALLHEQIKAKIMQPLAKKKALAVDTAAVLELMLDPHRGQRKNPGP